jgi:hypothetical protein
MAEKPTMESMNTGQFRVLCRAAAWAACAWFGACAALCAGDLDPALVGQWPGYGGGQAVSVAVAGNRAYVTTQDPGVSYRASLQVFDIGGPAKPNPVGGRDLAMEIGYVAVSGNYAYVSGRHGSGTNWVAALDVIDISNPSHPRLVGWCDMEDGSVWRVAVSGNHAYLAGNVYDATGDSRCGLRVIDVSNPAKPQLVGWHDWEGVPYDVAVSGNHAYLSGWRPSGTNGVEALEVIDISTPAQPQRVAVLECLYGQQLAVSGLYAYVSGSRAIGTNYLSGLEVIDLSIPTAPRLVARYDREGIAACSAVSGNYAVVSGDWQKGDASESALLVIDISSPASPQQVGYLTNMTGWDMALSGNSACLVGRDFGLQMIDISDPVNPQLAGGYRTAYIRLGNLEVVGRYAYVPDGDRVHVLDISQPATPQRVGGLDIVGEAGLSSLVAIRGDYACVTGSRYVDGSPASVLQVIDIRDPPKPHLLGHYELEAWPGGLGMSGHYAYITVSGIWDGTNYLGGNLGVIDITDPAHPQRVGKCELHWPHGLAVSGEYAYVAAGSALQVIDISNPANPWRAGGYATPGEIGDVAVSGEYAYATVGDWSEGTRYHPASLWSIDISNPPRPQPIGQCDIGSYAGLVVVSGAYAYADGGALRVIDISRPAALQRLGSYSYVTGVAVAGNYAYVTDGEDLKVVELLRTANPQRVGRDDTGEACALNVTVSDHYAFVAETIDSAPRLRVVDVANPASPQRLGGLDGMNGLLAVWGHYAFAVDSNTGLKLLDISNPADMRTVVAMGGGASAVAVSGNYAFVARADWLGGLQVFDMSDPAHPLQVGALGGIGADHVALSGNHAFVAGSWQEGADWKSGLVAIDVSDPTHPQRVGTLVGIQAMDVVVSGNHAFVSGAWAEDGVRKQGLMVIDISNPASPQRVGGYDAGTWVNGVAVSGTYAYLAEGGGLEVIDVSDPANPRRIGGNGAMYPYDVAVAGRQVFVAAGLDGLVILEMLPFFKSISHDEAGLQLSWEGFGAATLQRTTELTNPDWQDMLGSERLNRVTLPIWSGNEFFRLVKQ